MNAKLVVDRYLVTSSEADKLMEQSAVMDFSESTWEEIDEHFSGVGQDIGLTVEKRKHDVGAFARRPFSASETHLLANGTRCLDVTIGRALTEAERLEIAEATNNRFEAVLVASERDFGVIDERKYQALVESFIERVVKPCCTKVED